MASVSRVMQGQRHVGAWGRGSDCGALFLATDAGMISNAGHRIRVFQTCDTKGRLAGAISQSNYSFLLYDCLDDRPLDHITPKFTLYIYPSTSTITNPSLALLPISHFNLHGKSCAEDVYRPTSPRDSNSGRRQSCTEKSAPFPP